MTDVAFAVEAELAPDRLDGLTRDLIRDLGRVGMQARAVETLAGPGDRGVMTSIGKFVVETLWGGKTATALLDVLKAYLSRESSLRISIIKPDGTKIEIDTKNVGSGVVAKFLGAASAITE
jgi:hypothetical protein